MPTALPAALAARGIGVLVLDLGSVPSSDTTSPDEVDLAALTDAVNRLRNEYEQPILLVGHSAAGPAALVAAATVPGIHAVVTIGSPAPRTRAPSAVPTLVMHAPNDQVVPIREASRVFTAVRHPRSFIALDGVDHDLTESSHALRVAVLIAAWFDHYMRDDTPSSPVDATDSVVVTDDATGRYAQTIKTGRHLLTADEPSSVGGADAGPNPYELLLAALGACTSMTMRMYADRKGLPLHRTTVRLRHDRIHAKDCAQCEQQDGITSLIHREIDVEGPLNDEERGRLIEIADRCPVHRTLLSEIVIETTEA